MSLSWSQRLAKYVINGVTENMFEVRYRQISKDPDAPAAPHPVDLYSLAKGRKGKVRESYFKLDRETGIQASIYCKECKSTCNSLSTLEYHIKGDKHRRRVTGAPTRKQERRLKQMSQGNPSEALDSVTTNNFGEHVVDEAKKDWSEDGACQLLDWGGGQEGKDH